MIKQTLSILLVSLRSLPSRISQSFVIMFGIGGVVAVLVSLLAMAQGFEKTLRATGHTDRAIVLRAGSTSEINGSLSADQYRVIRDLPGVVSQSDIKLASMETFVTVNLTQRQDAADASVPMRGISTESFLVRPEVNIVSGRNIELGKYELIAGVNAANQIAGVDLNRTIKIRGVDWTVVGLFSASGGAFDSELWVDQRLLAAAWNRGDAFSSMLVRLTAPEQFSAFQASIQTDKRLLAHAIRESDFYADQSKTTTDLISGVGLLIGVIMSIGAVFAALNSMYAALAGRTSEIATLRALGFRQAPILFSVLIEATLIGTVGGAAAGLLVYFLLNGVGISTVAATSSTFTQIAFDFQVTQRLVGIGLLLAVCLGLIGGAIPAMLAVRRPITLGLRKGG